MAKERRSNREAKKPKQIKPKAAASASPIEAAKKAAWAPAKPKKK